MRHAGNRAVDRRCYAASAAKISTFHDAVFRVLKLRPRKIKRTDCNFNFVDSGFSKLGRSLDADFGGATGIQFRQAEKFKRWIFSYDAIH